MSTASASVFQCFSGTGFAKDELTRIAAAEIDRGNNSQDDFCVRVSSHCCCVVLCCIAKSAVTHCRVCHPAAYWVLASAAGKWK